MKLGRLGTYALAAAVLTACTTTNVSVQGEPVRLAPGSAIAVSASAALESNSTVRCVANALDEAGDSLREISLRKFRDTVFDGEDPPSGETALPDRMIQLKDDPRYRARLAALGLRYMVLVDAPETSQKFSGAGCEGGGGGVICGAAWDRNSKIRATTIDLVEGRETGSVSAYSRGKRVVLLPLPMYFPAPTEGEACKKLGKTLAEQFSGEPDPSAGEDRAILPRTPSIPEIKVMGTYKCACSHAPLVATRPNGACLHPTAHPPLPGSTGQASP
jgi:hypothetical protein